jgi:hypothetical protein
MTTTDVGFRPILQSHGVLRVAVSLVALTIMSLGPKDIMGQSQWDALIHASAFSYADSELKEDGYAAGFYGTYGTGWKHLLEVGASLTRINYLGGYQHRQTDLAAAYNLFGRRGSGRIGAHLLLANDPLTDGGTVVFAGGNAYEVGVWSVGAEGTYSSYPDYDGGLTVAQLAPTAGLTWSNATLTRIVGVTARGYYIRLSDDPGLGDREFLSAETGLSLTTGALTLTAYAWFGEQAFAVRNAGFLVFNLAELHTGGYGGGLRWVTSPRSALSAGFYQESFEDLGLPGEARTRTFTASLGITL